MSCTGDWISCKSCKYFRLFSPTILSHPCCSPFCCIPAGYLCFICIHTIAVRTPCLGYLGNRSGKLWLLQSYAGWLEMNIRSLQLELYAELVLSHSFWLIDVQKWSEWIWWVCFREANIHTMRLRCFWQVSVTEKTLSWLGLLPKCPHSIHHSFSCEKK